MKKENIIKAVRVINRNLKFYQKKLTYQLELKAEEEFNNANLKVDSLGDYESHIKKYEIILADLATIKRAIKNNNTSIRIYGTADSRNLIYDETLDVLKKSGFDVDTFDYVTLDIFPIEEYDGDTYGDDVYDDDYC